MADETDDKKSEVLILRLEPRLKAWLTEYAKRRKHASASHCVRDMLWREMEKDNAVNPKGGKKT